MHKYIYIARPASNSSILILEIYIKNTVLY